MSRDEIMKAILAGFVVVALVVTAIVIGSKKATTPKLTAPTPVAPAPEPPAPMLPPTAPQPPEKVFSQSFIRGYHDGYSGAWLAPARWMVVSEYRAGHHAGRQDRVAGKPNRFVNPTPSK